MAAIWIWSVVKQSNWIRTTYPPAIFRSQLNLITFSWNCLSFLFAWFLSPQPQQFSNWQFGFVYFLTNSELIEIWAIEDVCLRFRNDFHSGKVNRHDVAFKTFNGPFNWSNGKKVRDEKVNVSMLQPMCLNKYMMIFFLSSLWHTKNAFKAKPISD